MVNAHLCKTVKNPIIEPLVEQYYSYSLKSIYKNNHNIEKLCQIHQKVCPFLVSIMIFQMLDLSYNNLSQEDLLSLGLLTQLKVLHLTGNHFRQLPQDLAMPYLSREKYVCYNMTVKMIPSSLST